MVCMKIIMQDETEEYEAMLGTMLEANKSAYDCSTMNLKNIINGASKVRHDHCPLHTTYDIFNMPSLKKENKVEQDYGIQSKRFFNRRNEFHVKSIQSSSESYFSKRQSADQMQGIVWVKMMTYLC